MAAIFGQAESGAMVTALGALCPAEMVLSERGTRMKVLQVTPSFYPAHFYGGPTQSVYALCRHLSQAGCEVRSLTTDANGPAVLKIPTDTEVQLEDGVRVTYCKRNFRPDLSQSMMRRMNAMIRWADIVHITYLFSTSSLVSLAIANLANRAVVLSPRGALQPYGLNRRPMAKRMWMTACRAVKPQRLALHVTSEKEKSDAAEVWPDIPCYMVANGVESAAEVRHHSRAGKLKVLFIGRLHPVKGLENLIEACETVPQVDLTIAGIGDDEYVRTLRQRVERSVIKDRAHFTGEAVGADKERVFSEADVVVLPSHSENFGLAVAEALVRGVPVIASRGTPWAKVEQIGCGLHVDNDPQSLSSALKRIQQMPLDQMGGRGRTWMQADYTWEAQAKRMMTVYREVINL
jgi:glycosyltransferase involved in cell wall biosynthesis